MTQALLNLPARVRRGEIFEIRALVAHPMETGLRTGPNGGIVPRNIIEQFRSSAPRCIRRSPPIPIWPSSRAPPGAA